jgi:uncharacterized membrane protein
MKTSTLGILLIGIGMGGFVDGIVLHQILQWHNMLSNRVPPETMEAMRLNMLWDGLFHALVWIITMVGIFMLWRAARQGQAIPALPTFIGLLLIGWGLFNLVEGIINHHILQIHHVREVANYNVYNLTFLAVGGVLLILVGWLLARTGERTNL